MENVYTVKIYGFEITLYSTETEEYTRKIAAAVEEKIKEQTDANPSASLTKASILALMELYDQLIKLQVGADNMRLQLKDYLDDTTKAIAERDEARRTAEKLRDELLALKIDLSNK
ncbi:MAG: cell division protein ZapA [Clostridia bacterium]|nr:cell division protein ZapA [Clostridia bacterium]MBR5721589.1 cell division protein ZapA [Clostridia bacterium]